MEIKLCFHCGIEIASGKYCEACKTASGRKEMENNNKKLNPKYKCKICEK